MLAAIILFSAAHSNYIIVSPEKSSSRKYMPVKREGAREESKREIATCRSPVPPEYTVITTPPSALPSLALPVPCARLVSCCRQSDKGERRSEVRYARLRRPSPSCGRDGRAGGGVADGQIERTYSAACPVRFFRSSWTTAGRERMLGCHFPTLPMALAFRVKHGAGPLRVYIAWRECFSGGPGRVDCQVRRDDTLHAISTTPSLSLPLVSHVLRRSFRVCVSHQTHLPPSPCAPRSRLPSPAASHRAHRIYVI